MPEDAHERIYRKDYRPSEFLVDDVELCFALDPAQTVVKAKIRLRRNPNSPQSNEPLVLHGDQLELRSVRLDGTTLDPSRFEADPQSLRIPDVPERFELETEVAIHPGENTKLIGL